MRSTIVLILTGILLTTNGYAQWSEIYYNSHSNASHRAIHFINDSTGFLASTVNVPNTNPTQYNTLILKTKDWGITWDTVSYYPSLDANLWPVIYNITFINEQIGIASGQPCNKLLHTYDGGETWQLRTDSTVFFWPGCESYLHFLDENIGFACTTSEVYKTQDGGQSWVQINDSSSSFHQITSTNGGKLYSTRDKSIDNGETWHSMYQDPGLSFNRKCVGFINDSTGFIGGYTNWTPQGTYGVLSKTNNYGQTWDSVRFSSITIYDIQFINEQVGYMGSPIHKTVDGGNTWHKQFTFDGVNTVPGFRISCPSPNVCYSIGRTSKKVFRTLNGGGFPFSSVMENEQTAKNTFTFYPNPATQSITIKTQLVHSAQLVIYDVMGKEVQRQQINAKESTVDVSALSNGVYFVRVNEEVRKLIKGE
jgi:photosystem II stability/assembly factor-like uncharacterized protein